MNYQMLEQRLSLVRNMVYSSLMENYIPFPLDRTICSGWAKDLPCSGPSSTADIESKQVTPATGPREFHLVLVDNGRRKTIGDPDLRDALLCIKCGRCYFACPVYEALGSDWMQPPYGGPMGAMWSVVINDDTRPANLCTHSGGCKVVCPVQIDIPEILEHFKYLDAQKRG